MRNPAPIEAIAAVSRGRALPALAAVRAPATATAVDAFEGYAVSPVRALNLQVATQNGLLKALMASNLSRMQHLTSMAIIRNIGAGDHRG